MTGIDPVTLAHELDQAWEAYQHALTALQSAQEQLAKTRRLYGAQAPQMTAYHYICGHAYGWLGGKMTAEEAMKLILDEVKRGNEANEQTMRITWGQPQ